MKIRLLLLGSLNWCPRDKIPKTTPGILVEIVESKDLCSEHGDKKKKREW